MSASFWATNTVDTATTAVTSEMLDKMLADMLGPRLLEPEPWIVPAWFARLVATDPNAYRAVEEHLGKPQADALQRLGESL